MKKKEKVKRNLEPFINLHSDGGSTPNQKQKLVRKKRGKKIVSSMSGTQLDPQSKKKLHSYDKFSKKLFKTSNYGSKNMIA